MLILQGKGVSGGVAIGRVRLVRPAAVDVARTAVDDIAAEWARYEAARGQTIEELERLYEWSQDRVGRKDAQIFSVHAMIAEDEDFNGAVWQEIHNHSNAEYAVLQAAEAFSASFAAPFATEQRFGVTLPKCRYRPLPTARTASSNPNATIV
jgi:phosphotransferase system enzyme I (PtsI)